MEKTLTKKVKDLTTVLIPATAEVLKIFSKNRGKESKKQLLDRKKKIDDLQKEIKALEQVKEKVERELQEICHHPVSEAVYEGSYYYSEDDYGRRTDWKNMFETVKCEICGSEINVEGECHDSWGSRKVIKFKIDTYPAEPVDIIKQVLTNAPELRQHCENSL